MTTKIGYANVEIPTDKEPKDYHYTQRRAEILKLILEAGHPDLVSRKMLCERYGLSHSQISQDFSVLREYVAETIGNDAKLVTESVYRKSIKELLRNKQHDKAVRVIESWNNWLFDIGVQDKAAQKIQHQGDSAEPVSIKFNPFVPLDEEKE